MSVLAVVEIAKMENARAAGLPYIMEPQPDVRHVLPVYFDDGDDGIETID